MVSNVLSLTNNGLRDWIVQRVSAIVLAAYIFCLFGFCVTHYPVTFEIWQAFLQSTIMKIFTILALLSLVLHAWVGMWTVLTDYVKCTALRMLLTVGVILTLFAYFIWGILIMWGVQ